MVQLIEQIHRHGDTRAHDAAEAPPRIEAPFSLWGLAPVELHDAYWRSKGIQCVRRGQVQPFQRAAELFLLIEPEQMVLFNIAELSDRLTWRDAALTRIRIVSEGCDRYSEHVVVDDRGLVECIERRYRPRVERCARVMVTSYRRIAHAWMTARSRREGWKRVRRSVAWAQIDYVNTAGRVFCTSAIDDQQRMLDELMQVWSCPNRSIDGLEELEPGVWHVAGEPVTPGVLRVGPLWLGRGACENQQACVIGPKWFQDQSPAPQSAIIKNIDDVELNQPPDLPRPRAAWVHYPLAKRCIDIIGSLAALIVSAPVMAMVAICILLEDGRPLFFGHVRQGRNGRLFRCWKFRTMHRNAHQLARELAEDNICDGPQVYIKNDPRVTRVGRILRATNIDELPQFWNVLIGHMSLVGPRPSPDDENQFCPAWRDLRLSVRPGITGLWQLNRTRTRGHDFQEWIKYDIEYVQNASLWLDLKIIVRTALMLLRGRSPHAPE